MEDVFEFAMKMEEDGKAYYEDMANKTTVPALKKILNGLADDEARHYKIFKSLKEQHADELAQLETQSTTILSTAKNVFEQLSHENTTPDTKAEVVKVWKNAQDVEKKSEDLYREKAEIVEDAKGKEMLHKIADEEHKHWALIESVLKFLDRPNHWLEDAEWNHLEEY